MTSKNVIENHILEKNTIWFWKSFLWYDIRLILNIWNLNMIKTAQVITTCTVHCHNIGRTFNLHPYRESGQTHRKTWKRHTRSLLYQICNETSLDLNTLAKVVVFIEILSSILGLFYCTIYMVLCKMEGVGNRKIAFWNRMWNYFRIFAVSWNRIY